MGEKFNKEVGVKLFYARKAHQMTRAELGLKIGLHESTIKRYEDGEIKSLDIEKIKEFAEALEVDPAYLMGWDEQVNKPQISLSSHENKVITAYRNQPDTQPFVDKLLGVEREEETFNIAKAARNQKPLKMTREQEKAFAESANKAPNSSQRRDMF